MTIDNTGVVDIVGIHNKTGYVVLTICDHLEWNDDEHLYLLQEKINRYLSYIESGEVLERFPTAKVQNTQIDILFKHPPDDAATKFLNQCKEIIEGAGIKFEHRISED